MLPGWLYREFDDPIVIMLSFLVRVYAIEFVIYTLYIHYLDMLLDTLPYEKSNTEFSPNYFGIDTYIRNATELPRNSPGMLRNDPGMPTE